MKQLTATYPLAGAWQVPPLHATGLQKPPLHHLAQLVLQQLRKFKKAST